MNDAFTILNCLVVDDEPLAIELLSDYIAKTPGLRLSGAFSDPVKALELAKNNKVDVIFLDVQMPEMNGIQFMQALKEQSMIVLTTAYTEYALEGFTFNVIDYLLKPITIDRFLICIKRLFEHQYGRHYLTTKNQKRPDDTNFIFVKTEYKILKVKYDDILYLEGARDYVVINLIQGLGQVLTLQGLKSIEEMLPSDKFIRVHKSYIIAIDKISYIEKGTIKIDKHYVPIGNTYKEDFYSRIKI
jgi:DNA-binding LytR/AlgR family response regulator